MAWEAGTKAFGSLATASLELQSAEGFNGCSSERPNCVRDRTVVLIAPRQQQIVSSEKPRSPATLAKLVLQGQFGEAQCAIARRRSSRRTCASDIRSRAPKPRAMRLSVISRRPELCEDTSEGATGTQACHRRAVVSTERVQPTVQRVELNVLSMWHPIRLAENYAMADIVTDGCVIMGVGHG